MNMVGETLISPVGKGLLCLLVFWVYMVFLTDWIWRDKFRMQIPEE